MKKVTYNKYSCVISGMSREMMKMDGRDSAECQNWEKKDIMVIIEIVVNENNAKNCTVLSSPIKMTKKRAEQRGWMESSRFSIFVLEREPLLSSFSANPTVGSVRDKKESCSTRRGLRVGTGFKEFPQTPRGRGFSLLGFYTLFKYRELIRIVWVNWMMNCSINHVLVCLRPEWP